jgi:predicted DNA-binding transcriptional regulator AlpA
LRRNSPPQAEGQKRPKKPCSAWTNRRLKTRYFQGFPHCAKVFRDRLYPHPRKPLSNCLQITIERRSNMTTTYTSYEQLPLALNADDVAAVLGVSRANAYTIMHSKGFPTIVIGKRMIVPKDKLLAWMEEQLSA